MEASTAVLTGISSMATRQVLAELAAAYEQRTGTRVVIEAVGGVEAARRVRDGEPFDIVVLASPVVAQLEAEARVVAGSRADVARSGIAVAVREGAPRPSMTDADAVKQAILRAGRIAYSTGPSGDHLKALLNKWSIADQVSPRAVQAPAGVPVARLIAEGQADLGFQQLSELLGAPGIAVLGPLPPEIQATTIFSAAIGIQSPHLPETRALTAYLASPEAEEAKRRYGMEPGS